MTAPLTPRDAQYNAMRDRARERRQVFAERHRVVERYLAGDSVLLLAKDLGATRAFVKRVLEDAAVDQRSVADANRLLMATRTPEENRANTRAAHAAVRGRTRPPEELTKAALTREARQTHTSEHEIKLAAELAARGLKVIPQKAVGPYNVDVATGTVAVEVFGGGWHAYGHHARRSPDRLRYILDAGWNLVVIWVSLERWPISAAACEYVVAFAELARRDPSMRGEYRVIWGDGEEVPAAQLEFDDLSVKPSRRRRLRKRP